jgi:hypothetical protein
MKNGSIGCLFWLFLKTSLRIAQVFFKFFELLVSASFVVLLFACPNHLVI